METQQYLLSNVVELKTCHNADTFQVTLVAWYQFKQEWLLLYGELASAHRKAYLSLHIKCPIFLSNSNLIWIFSTVFRKSLQYQIEWKSVQWERSSSWWTNGQTQLTDRHDGADGCWYNVTSVNVPTKRI